MKVLAPALLAIAIVMQIGTAAADDGDGQSWSGLYVGAHVAYGWGDVDWAADYVANAGAFQQEIDFAAGSPNATGNHDIGGLAGGIHIGGDMQFDSIVVGVVGDSTWGSIDGDGPIPSSASRAENSMDWLGSVRGRIGMTANNTLFYLTAGGAWAKGDGTITALSSERGTVTRSADYDGYVVGGGIEFPTFGPFTLQAEYLRYDLESDRIDFGTINNGRLSLYAEDEVNINMLKLSMNYRF